MALAALIDATHRSALGNWARSGGQTDAVAELEAGMDWIRALLTEGGGPRSVLLAVLPDSARTRRSLSALRDRASETL